MNKKNLITVYNYILEQNKKLTSDSVVHSDELFKHIQAMHGYRPVVLNRIIDILKESHQIFIFEIVQEDKMRHIDRIDGYVVSDLGIIRDLKSTFHNALMDEYEQQHVKRLMPHQIVKEVYNRIRLYKNTIIGLLANKAIMLEEYEKLLEKNYTDYTPDWQESKLKWIISEDKDFEEENNKDKAATKADASDQSRRAVDTNTYTDYKQDIDKYPPQKVLQIYGVDFFLRVNLRKYKFNTIRELIEKQKLDRKTDLKKLKSMIEKIYANKARDPKLNEYTSDLKRLESIVKKTLIFAR